MEMNDVSEAAAAAAVASCSQTIDVFVNEALDRSADAVKARITQWVGVNEHGQSYEHFFNTTSLPASMQRTIRMMRRTDHQDVDFLVSCFPLADSDSAIVTVLGVAENIPECRRNTINQLLLHNSRHRLNVIRHVFWVRCGCWSLALPPNVFDESSAPSSARILHEVVMAGHVERINHMEDTFHARVERAITASAHKETTNNNDEDDDAKENDGDGDDGTTLDAAMAAVRIRKNVLVQRGISAIEAPPLAVFGDVPYAGCGFAPLDDFLEVDVASDDALMPPPRRQVQEDTLNLEVPVRPIPEQQSMFCVVMYVPVPLADRQGATTSPVVYGAVKVSFASSSRTECERVAEVLREVYMNAFDVLIVRIGDRVRLPPTPGDIAEMRRAGHFIYHPQQRSTMMDIVDGTRTADKIFECEEQ